MTAAPCTAAAAHACTPTIQPSPSQWGGLLRARPPIDARARRFREQLGLALEHPVIMAGHQAGFWHPGILAKLFAITAASRALGARAAWVVVDQDDHDPWTIRYPVRRADGTLEARSWNIHGPAGANSEATAHVAVAHRAPALNIQLPALAANERWAAPNVLAGLASIAAAVEHWDMEPAAAAQLIGAASEISPAFWESTTTFRATSLARTDLFTELVRAMQADPARTIETYNAAVAAHPGAGIAPLAHDELPLWHIPAKLNAPRRRVTLATLPSIRSEELCPRALLMTGLLRWAGCDIFVHGTGGAGADGAGGYDAITTDWFKSWLNVDLAPVATVTATLRLNIDGADTTLSPSAIAQTRWLAHAARHRPSLLGDPDAERERTSAIATLRSLRWKRDPAAKRTKLETYRVLHRVLETARTRHAPDLARLDSAAASAAARRAEAEIIADRTWAWPLYQPDQIATLKSAIDAAFGG